MLAIHKLGYASYRQTTDLAACNKTQVTCRESGRLCPCHVKYEYLLPSISSSPAYSFFALVAVSFCEKRHDLIPISLIYLSYIIQIRRVASQAIAHTNLNPSASTSQYHTLL